MENTAAIATEASVFKCPTALPPGGYANIDGPSRDSDSAAPSLDPNVLGYTDYETFTSVKDKIFLLVVILMLIKLAMMVA